MKINVLEYKGYHTEIEFDSKEKILIGKIEGISDLVNFECDKIENIEKEFHEAVDDYLEFCKEVGKEPDKEYKGVFNVRITPELHKKLANIAMKNGDSLNEAVKKAIQKYTLDNDDFQKCLRDTIELIFTRKPKTESTYQYNKNSFILHTNKIYGNEAWH